MFLRVPRLVPLSPPARRCAADPRQFAIYRSDLGEGRIGASGPFERVSGASAWGWRSERAAV